MGTMAGLLDCLCIRLRSFEGIVLVARDLRGESSRSCNGDGGGARLEMADARDDDRDLIWKRRVDGIGIGAIAPHDSFVARRLRCRLLCAMRMHRMRCFDLFVELGDDVWPDLRTRGFCDKMRLI